MGDAGHTAGGRPDAGCGDADWLAGYLRALVTARPSAWASSDLTLSQLTALHFICARGPISLAALSAALGTGPPATCAMVDRLARAGLVHREPDPDDHRRVRLAISGEARPMLGSVDLATARRLQSTLRGMRPATQRRLCTALRDAARQLSY